MPPPAKSCDVRDMGALTSPLKFLDQDYQKLLQESLSRKELYTDELFPSNSCSIGNLSHKRNKIDYSQIVWKRPSVCKQCCISLSVYTALCSITAATVFTKNLCCMAPCDYFRMLCSFFLLRNW